MSRLAVLLVLISCVTHAGWNILAKRAKTTPGFFWLTNLAVIVAAAPFFGLLGGGGSWRCRARWGSACW